jgi:hypothetical protein
MHHPRVTTRCEVAPETAHGQPARNARPVREGRSRDQPRRPAMLITKILNDAARGRVNPTGRTLDASPGS